jgi:hypothetical protein
MTQAFSIAACLSLDLDERLHLTPALHSCRFLLIGCRTLPVAFHPLPITRRLSLSHPSPIACCSTHRPSTAAHILVVCGLFWSIPSFRRCGGETPYYCNILYDIIHYKYQFCLFHNYGENHAKFGISWAGTYSESQHNL